MTKPTKQPAREPALLDCEDAIYELVGAASIASAFLYHFAEDGNSARSETMRLGLPWLGHHLAANAENLVAVLEMREVRWCTTMKGDAIAKVLELAARAGKDGAARSGGSAGE